MLPVLAAVFCLILGFPACFNVSADTQTLQSTALRLEVETSPFAFRVIEKTTSQLLVAHANTILVFGGSSNSVSAATNIMMAGTNLIADLQLAGTSATARASFTFVQPEVVTVSFATTNNATQIAQGFLDQGENYYGVWEYPFGGKLDLRGTDQPFLGVGPATGANYCSGRAPFYLTSRKYGLYVESEAEGRFAVGVGGQTRFSFNAPQMRFHIIYGPLYSDILRRYNVLAGGAYMPPTWAFSTIWWKDDDHRDFHGSATNARGNVLDTADKLQSNQIPASALWIDRPYTTGQNGWGNLDFDSSFPEPLEMVSDLNARGMNLMLWIANRCWSGNSLYTNGSSLGYLFTDSSGSAADLLEHFVKLTHGKAFVLFTNFKLMQEVAELMQRFFDRLGVACFVQGTGTPCSVMLETFKDDVDSVLFGTDSF